MRNWQEAEEYAKWFVAVAVFLSFLVIGNLHLENNISGYAVSGTLFKEGDTIVIDSKFALNYEQPCQNILTFNDLRDMGNGSYFIDLSDEDGNPLDGFPYHFNSSQIVNGVHKFNISYNLYGEDNLLYNYTVDALVNEKKLKLVDTTQPCPSYCGNEVCEKDEGFLEQYACREDCMRKQGDTILLGEEDKHKFFEINYGQECRAVFYFKSYTIDSVKINEYDPDTKGIIKYHSLPYNKTINTTGGYPVILMHGSNKTYFLKFNDTNESLFLDETDKGCADGCSSVGEKRCYNFESYQSCTTDELGYLSWGNAINCKPKICNVDVSPNNPCVDNCTQECTTDGEKRCYNEESIETCGNFDDDWCFEWGDLTSCGEWEVCNSSACIPSCQDECSTEGELTCVSDNSTSYVAECGDFDEDPCMDTRHKEDCLEGYTCTYNESMCMCKEDWECSDWSECSENKQTRTCSDRNECGTTYEKDDFPESKSCDSGEPELDCNNPVQYGPWGECDTTGKRTRTLYYAAGCSLRSASDTEDCVYTAPEPFEEETKEKEIIQEEPSQIRTTEEDTSFIASAPAIDPSILKSEVEEEPDIEINFGLIAMVLVLIGVTGGGGVYYYLNMSKSNLDAEKQSGASSETNKQLQDYTKRMIAQGYTKDQVKQMLLKEGWQQKDVDSVMKGVSAADTSNQLVSYVKQMRSSGYNDQQITAELTKQGWQKNQIDKAIKS